jgi:hypothetical protein
MSHICRSSVVPSEGHETRRDDHGHDETDLLARLLAFSPTSSHVVSTTSCGSSPPSASVPTNLRSSGDGQHAHGTPYISGSGPRSRSPVEPVDQKLPRPADLSRRGNV